MTGDQLEPYRQKRHFDRTAEPAGGEADAVAEPGWRFVVQEHQARRHHYDVRFEVDGVMASWAVPKGPSYDPAVKRLAVHVEDHPLDYRTFEGTIPQGEYGGGTVIVWDQGTYRNDSSEGGRPIGVRQAIDKGHLRVWMTGDKLRGGWSLVRTGGRRGDDRNWLMIKQRDDTADPERDVEADSPASVQTGRRLSEVAADPEARRWTAAVATWRPPMLAELLPTTNPAAVALPAGEWRLERKYDGLRCVAVRNGDEVVLWSRGHQPYTRRFPAVVRALRALPADNFVIDGELVAFDPAGHSSFALLQAPGSAAHPVLCVFDLVHLLGKDTSGLPLEDRQELLGRLLVEGDDLRMTEFVEGSPAAAALAQACARGWEGLVAKRAGSVYRSGRSADWRKLKCSASQELVVGGWTDPQGKRTGFGALLVGYYEGEALRYAGKVGTGFDTATLDRLSAELAAREVPASPFADHVREKGAHWCRPELVAQVGFTEWTADGRLRHPRFLGLRSDKPAAAVVREAPLPPG